MKYIEELSVGDTFTLDNNVFILTSDFKNNGDRSCILLSNGNPRWLSSQTTVEVTPIYILDKDNTIIPLKPTTKND